MSSAFDRPSFMQHHWFGAWFRERILAAWWWLVPASITIALIGGARDWFVRTIAAGTTLVALRLFDDLTDVEHDRKNHPKRVLCQINSLTPVYIVCTVGSIFSTLTIFAVGSNVAIYIAAVALILAAARLRQNTFSSARILFVHVILLKFPALTIALALPEATPNKPWIYAMSLYGFVGVYEVLHDATARRSKCTNVLFGLDVVCLIQGLMFCLGSCLHEARK